MKYEIALFASFYWGEQAELSFDALDSRRNEYETMAYDFYTTEVVRQDLVDPKIPQKIFYV